MAVLLQYWQDHISVPLYGSSVRKASKLADTLMRDINPWKSHKVKFGWDYITNHATTWLDVCEQFVKEHFQEWEVQKTCPYELGPLENSTEFAYQRLLAQRQAESDATDSCKEEAKKLPLEHQVAWDMRRWQATPAKENVCLAGTESSLYTNWHLRQNT